MKSCLIFTKDGHGYRLSGSLKFIESLCHRLQWNGIPNEITNGEVVTICELKWAEQDCTQQVYKFDGLVVLEVESPDYLPEGFYVDGGNAFQIRLDKSLEFKGMGLALVKASSSKTAVSVSREAFIEILQRKIREALDNLSFDSLIGVCEYVSEGESNGTVS